RGELRFVWASSRDGALARGASASAQRLLTPGAHVLTLTVTDPWGLACTTTVNVTVNAAPSVRVMAVRQDGVDCLENPCREGRPLDVLGFVQDLQAPGGLARLTWLDSLGAGLEEGDDSSLPGLVANPIARLTAPGRAGTRCCSSPRTAPARWAGPRPASRCCLRETPGCWSW
ncbi:hypothetical protein ACLESO_36445, partial [Pyxidicoccus sp. 3LG]